MSEDLKANIPSFKLNNGLKLPAIGYGTWLGLDENLNLIYQDLPKLVEAMSYAIDVGYRHIDTGHPYRTEPQVGYVVRKKIKEGVVKREELFITTKVWQHNHRPADVEASVRGSLERMGLDYVDLLLIHFPCSASVDGVDEKIDYLDTWRGFESVVKKGLVKSIGVSNFNLEQMKRLLKNCHIKPVVNQIELHLNLGQKELVSYCRKNDVLCVAYTPFGGMMASEAWRRVISRNTNSRATKADDPKLNAIAKKHGKSVSQVCLRYLYERGVAAIPKTLMKSRVIENASLFDFKFDDDDIAALEQFDNNYRITQPTYYQNFDNYPFDKLEGHDDATTSAPRACNYSTRVTATGAVQQLCDSSNS